MTPLNLHCHSATPAAAIESLTVEVDAASEGLITLRYRLAGDLSRVKIPARQTASAADGLWRHTCFEAFAAGESPSYREFNFSPSEKWAAYAFRDYRIPAAWQISWPPSIEVAKTDGGLTLTAQIALRDLPAGNRIRLGLTAVIEAADGSLSYWALTHAGGKPDFHDAASFTHTLVTVP